jgi:DNA polymerase III delta subunit
MKPVLAVQGPREAGPGERDEMLRRAIGLLEQAGAEGIDRFEVPGRGQGEESEGVLRPEVEGAVPALQSGSLFGGSRGVLVIGANRLLKAEAEILADLALGLDGSTAVVCFVSDGSLPSPLAKAVKEVGESVSVKKFREHDAADWVARSARDRELSLASDAVMALVQRFGSDIASLGKALDQLAEVEGQVTAEEVAARFRNRPDEPMWHYADAVGDGDSAEALRRLTDFLTHGHPLQLLAFLEGDLKRRSLAAAAPDIDTFAEWAGGSADHFPIRKAWRARGAASEENLRRALDAMARADLHLKTMPEAGHLVTMERLTVALCRWYGGRTRRAG